MLWMCLHFPKLALEVFTQNQDIHSPFVIEEHNKNRRLVLLSNPAAETAGIQAGMTIPTAHSLCELLIVKERDPSIEANTLSRIALHLTPFSPTISLQTPNTILIEVGSCLRLFGGLKSLHQQITQQLFDMGYAFQLAVAKTPLAAEMAAQLLDDPEKYLISDAYIQQIPISALNYRRQQDRIDHKTLQRLQGVGLRRLGEVLELPRPELGHRFGESFLDYLDKVIGKKLDVRPLFQAPSFFEHHIHFVEELSHLNALLFPIKRLLNDLVFYLRQRQQAINALTLLLENRHNETNSIELNFAEPQHRVEQILPLIKLKFETLVLSSPIITVGLKATQIVEHEIKMIPLLPTLPGAMGGLHPPVTDSDKAALINRLKARLGDHHVKGLKLLDDHRPEHCWTYTGPMHKQASQQNKTRPLWLLAQPQALSCQAGKPFWHGPLHLLNGPERIETGWWDNAPVNRDYFIARHQHGELLWVYRDKETEAQQERQHPWFLHGFFA